MAVEFASDLMKGLHSSTGDQSGDAGRRHPQLAPHSRSTSAGSMCSTANVSVTEADDSPVHACSAPFLSASYLEHVEGDLYSGPWNVQNTFIHFPVADKVTSRSRSTSCPPCIHAQKSDFESCRPATDVEAGYDNGLDRPVLRLESALFKPPAPPSPPSWDEDHAAHLLDHSSDLPSLGSAGHQFGQCKPCAFVHTKGCMSGRACQFCHLCDRDEKKRRQRERHEQKTVLYSIARRRGYKARAY